jgi:hypothetical protein
MVFPTDDQVDYHSWTPDIIIQEDIGEGLLSNTKLSNLICYSNGTTYNQNSGELLVSMSPSVSYYPYDA